MGFGFSQYENIDDLICDQTFAEQKSEYILDFTKIVYPVILLNASDDARVGTELPSRYIPARLKHSRKAHVPIEVAFGNDAVDSLVQ